MKLLLPLLSLLSLTSIVSSVQATQCALQPLKANLKNAEVIFKGKIVERYTFETQENSRRSFCASNSAERPNCGPKVAIFQIAKVFKGELSDERITVYSKDGCLCLGHYFKKGDEYLVFATKTNEEHPAHAKAELVASNVCGGTGNTSNPIIQKSLKELEKTKSS